VTLSIVAYDADHDLLGAAVTSCVLAAGRRVLHVRPGVGAAVTQAHSEIVWGDEILGALASGETPEAALAPYLRDDTQVAAVGGAGELAVHTGYACDPHAGHTRGDALTAQANTAQVPDASQRMVNAFSASEGRLAERLLAALGASGGDARGQQAAALIVAGPGPLRGDAGEPHVDLRVDDHRDPVAELTRLLSLHRATCRMRQLLETTLPVDQAEVAELLALHPDDPFLRNASLRLR
jgi:uncharacterized Ntn-hydrolase superfamily protein